MLGTAGGIIRRAGWGMLVWWYWEELALDEGSGQCIPSGQGVRFVLSVPLNGMKPGWTEASKESWSLLTWGAARFAA